MSNIDELLALAKKLVFILEDPNPGLISWRESLRWALDEIATFGGYEPVRRNITGTPAGWTEGEK